MLSNTVLADDKRHVRLRVTASCAMSSSKNIASLKNWIFEDGKDVGKMTIYETSLGENKVYQRKMTHLFHDKSFTLVYQDNMSKKSFVFEDENGLIALFGLKPKGTITTKMTGEILIKKDLSEDIKSDIFSLYLMAEAALRKMDERGI